MYLFQASGILNNIDLKGPISYKESDNSYLFINRNNSWDIHVVLKKGDNGNWYQHGGISVHLPQGFIEILGAQIDTYLESKTQS